MKLKVFEKIPVDGSISLQDLAKATGAQESLLGNVNPSTFPNVLVSDTESSTKSDSHAC
jgi:hypothetical protein